MDGEQNIDLAKFNFNVDDIVKGAAVLKSEIDKIKAQQTELRKAGQTSSIGFVENEAALKTLNKEYRLHVKALSDSAKAAQQSAIREQVLDTVLGAEVKTIRQARDQNKILNDLRNDANATTAEGREELRRLNEQLDRNNEFVKENADQYLKQKINIGNYKESIVEALTELQEQRDALQANEKALVALRDETTEGSEEWNFYNTQINQTNTQINALIINMGGLNDEATAQSSITKLLSGDFKGLATDAQEVGGAGNLMRSSLKGATTSLISITKASLAFIATPVGAILAVLVGAFLLIKNAMDRSEESTNKLKRAFAPLSGILDAVLGFLEPLGEFLIDGIVFGMQQAEIAIYKAIDAFADIASFLGFESLAAGAREFNSEIQQASADARALADAEAQLAKSMREARLVQLQYQKEAEQFRQIRDDENRSIQERIQANEDLGAVLEQQLQDELAIAQTALTVANLRIQAEGQSAEALDAQASALEQIADIEERITGQRSEQLTNRVSLEREAEQKRQEIIDARIAKMNEETALFIAQQGIRARTLEQELELERQVAQQRQAILDEELKNKRISQEAYQTAVLDLRNDLTRREAEIAVDNAAREIEQYRQQLEARQLENQFLSEQVVAQKVAENNALLAREIEFQELRRDQGVINENEFDLAIQEAREENRLLNKEIEDERIAVEKEEAIELRALEFEEELERQIAEGATRAEVLRAQQGEQRAVDIQRIQADRNAGIISEQLYQARLQQIDRQAKAQELERERILAEQKLNVATGLLSAASQVINKDSAAGKAIALAKAGINTYQGISAGVALGFPAAIPAVAAAAATGFKAIKDIASTKVPSAVGGGSASSGSGGSTPQGIGGVNLGSASNLTAIASSGNASVQNQIGQNASSLNIAESIGEAAFQGTMAGAQQGASDGITNLSANMAVQENSAF